MGTSGEEVGGHSHHDMKQLLETNRTITESAQWSTVLGHGHLGECGDEDGDGDGDGDSYDVR